MMAGTLGLDIGGANIKAAHSGGRTQSTAFPLWKAPDQLTRVLARLLTELPPWDRLAVTMTGELCDCFAGQEEGVRFILDAIAECAPSARVLVWSLQGRFLSVAEAQREPRLVAAANWLAQATWAARLLPSRAALLVDMGSTTTDIIPLWRGKPRPHAMTDPERLRSGELIYTGSRRTPVCAVLGPEVAAEFFATMADVYLVLGMLEEEQGNRDTADGRPCTTACAHARLARMLCADPEACPPEVTLRLAARARQRQLEILGAALERVTDRLPEPPVNILTSGSGEFVLRGLPVEPAGAVWRSLSDPWGQGMSTCACAWAVAQLAATHT